MSSVEAQATAIMRAAAEVVATHQALSRVLDRPNSGTRKDRRLHDTVDAADQRREAAIRKLCEVFGGGGP